MNRTTKGKKKELCRSRLYILIGTEKDSVWLWTALIDDQSQYESAENDGPCVKTAKHKITEHETAGYENAVRER